jgi:hypothetical protein
MYDIPIGTVAIVSTTAYQCSGTTNKSKAFLPFQKSKLNACIKVVRKARQIGGGENGQFRHNTASNA